MAYKIIDKRQFPSQLQNGRLGNVYEITFTAPPDVERDSVVVETLEPNELDKLIKAKIAEHAALGKLGR